MKGYLQSYLGGVDDKDSPDYGDKAALWLANRFPQVFLARIEFSETADLENEARRLKMNETAQLNLKINREVLRDKFLDTRADYYTAFTDNSKNNKTLATELKQDMVVPNFRMELLKKVYAEENVTHAIKSLMQAKEEVLKTGTPAVFSHNLAIYYRNFNTFANTFLTVYNKLLKYDLDKIKKQVKKVSSNPDSPLCKLNQEDVAYEASMDN